MSIGTKTTKSKDLGKSSKNAVKPRKIRTKVAMWVTARRRIICLPQPGSVCGIDKRVVCIPQPNAVCKSGQTRATTMRDSQSQNLVGDCEFSKWLKSRGEHDINTAITIGMSAHGRALFAARPIHTGECILQVSRELMITPDKLPEEVTRLLSKDVSEWARLALFLLAHQHRIQASPWAPYICHLPRLGGIHSTIFWKKEELAYLKQSPVHRETLQRRAVIKMEFAAVQNALSLCPNIFGDHVTLRDFKHAYATVCSRAWGIEALNTLALVPFVDFLNHDANCRSLLSYDEDRKCAEVIADRDYASGEQVIISYGQLSNATLALDFGFALAFNPPDQAEIWMGISRRDPLRDSKLQLLHSHSMPTLSNSDGFDTGGNSFTLQEVKSVTGKGKGIPQSLRAFARVVCATSSQELDGMANDAATSDGRLARRPSTDRRKEAEAMALLLTHVENRIQQHVAAVLALQDSPLLEKPRREISEAVLGGELRVLRSASAWLKEHCKMLQSVEGPL